jgi:hypothetical protein
MARKRETQTGGADKQSTIIPPDGEPRLIGHPDATAIWKRLEARGVPAGALDAALTGRDDGGYTLARKHTHPRDGGRYLRWPRPGHLVVWAEQLHLPLDIVLALFGYDVSAAPRQVTAVDVVGETDAAGVVHASAPGDRITVRELSAQCDALRVLVPLPPFGLPTDAVVIYERLEGVVSAQGRLCLARVLHADAPRLAWVTKSSTGALCTYQFADGAIKRGPLATCERVRLVLHPVHPGQP